jgi:hypothetical protein
MTVDPPLGDGGQTMRRLPVIMTRWYRVNVSGLVTKRAKSIAPRPRSDHGGPLGSALRATLEQVPAVAEVYTAAEPQ